MSLDYKTRIALNYLLATAAILLLVFSLIFFLVYKTVYNNLDGDLSYEAHKHTKEIDITQIGIVFKNKKEWEEREHKEVQVNPVFMQLMSPRGAVMDKSPNLKNDFLPFRSAKHEVHFDAEINGRKIRQVQLPVIEEGRIVGYIMAAISSEGAFKTLLRLRNVLVISFIGVLLILYFVSRFLAGRSIKPIQNVTNTISRITRNNLKDRVELPPHQDEIYDLSTSFNDLITRIENALEREKQFTSDASHELRTPLAALQGTLEILIRKPRSQQEYEQKVKYALETVSQMSFMLDQLLLLARLDEQSSPEYSKFTSLTEIVDQSLSQFNDQIRAKELGIDFSFNEHLEFNVPYFYASLILQNLLSNAIKYSKQAGEIKISIERRSGKILLSIQDNGIGIKEQDLSRIFDNFYRSEALNHKEIKGQGLGLSIVKKCVQAIKGSIDIKSGLHQGTTVMVEFESLKAD